METVFSTTDAQVIDAWEDIQRRITEWRAEMHAFAEQYTCDSPMSIQRSDSLAFVGLKADESPGGDEWRLDKKWQIWVPNRRTTEGRALHKQIDAMRVPGLRMLPGMPDIAMGPSNNGHWYTASIGLVDGVVWVGWTCDIEVLRQNGWSRNKLDETIWQQRRVSEFYAAQEAAEDAEKAKSTSGV